MVLLPYFDKVFLLQKLTGKKTAQKTEYHTLKQVGCYATSFGHTL